jgi:hypothetical protein
MKDQLITMVAEKTGLSADKATEAIDAVLGYLKENPTQISSLVGIEESNFMGEAREKLDEAREKLAPIGEKVGGRIGKLFGKKGE